MSASVPLPVKVALACSTKGKPLLESKHPVGLDWLVDDAGQAKGLHVVLEDLSTVAYTLPAVSGGWVAPGNTHEYDSSAALSLAEHATCAHCDSGNKLLAVGIQLGLRGSQGRIMLFDTARPLTKPANGAPKAPITLANVYQSSVLVEGNVTHVVINSSGDLLLALSSKTLMLMHIGCSAPAPPTNPMLRAPQASRTTAGLSKASQEAPPNPTWRQLWPEAEVSTTCFACSFSAVHPTHLLTLEKRRLQNESVESMRAIKYEYKGGQVRVLEHTTLPTVPEMLTACEWNADATQLVVGGHDGTLLLHDYSRGGLRTKLTPDSRPVQSLAWHPSGATIAAALEGGAVCILDCALQPLLVTASASRPSQMGPLFNASPLLGLAHPSKAPAKVVWNLAPGFAGLDMAALAIPGNTTGPAGEAPTSPASPELARSPSAAHGNGTATADAWAMATLQITAGPVSRISELMQRFLTDKEQRRALDVTDACGSSQAKYYAMSLLLNHLLREHRTGCAPAETLRLLDNALSLLWSQVSALEAGQAKVVGALFRRYAQQLAGQGQLEHAFRVAATLGSRPALEDVYVTAIQLGEANVAEAVHATIVKLPAEPGADAALPLPRVADLLKLQQMEHEAAQAPRVLNSQLMHASTQDCVAAGIALEARGRVHEALALYSGHNMQEAHQALSNLMQAAQMA